MKRRCEVCPAEVQAVCRHAFGKFWGDKSTNGEGCDHPLDGVAEAWYARGWKPGTGATKAITLPLPSAPRRPATVSMTQLKMPVRPKVSAKITKQAELFFRGLK
ncbi:MAG: hypothetical protein J6V72_11200 [Kiritimatiellae bacterium]|nr:hypothetical protein [Kiritimatiellia bacterium]